MNVRNLENKCIPVEMLKHDLGIGIIPIYTLNNGISMLIMGEYHNKGALSPTVGARFKNDDNIYTHLQTAFARKRLGMMDLDNEGKIQDNIYYSINEKQKISRLTFVQHIKVELSEDAFYQEYIAPMQKEALRQRSVSEFFWKLNETLDPKGSGFKFKSNEERSEFASRALANISDAKFSLHANITNQLHLLKNPNTNWEETVAPLEFYGKNGGRKYSELTAFYLIPLAELEKHFKNPKIKKDPEKPTIFIEYKNLPKEESWKKLFIFEEEVNLLADILQIVSSTQEFSSSLFESSGWKNLPSPWSMEKINTNQFDKKNEKSIPRSHMGGGK